MDHQLGPDEPLVPTIEYQTGKTMMAGGALALHDHVASRMEAALGKALPQVEVRFNALSITADVVVKDKTEIKTELPTLPNELMTTLRSFGTSKHIVKKHILKNVNGVIKPGTITLVLGQPGSGKSTLLKVLSGCFPKMKNTTVDGGVTYNGYPASELCKNLPQFTSYVSQRDKHYPSLSVKETLEFAHACSGGGLNKNDEQHFVNGTDKENNAALAAARAMYQHYPEIVIHQLGLDNCQNTVVGDAMIRGVSGGERKRVTTGEMAFGNKYVITMDEISTGLDSAATFDIIATQRSLAKKFRKTVVISLLQPSPEVYSLFDSVIILNEGQIMYNGPRAEALEYFESLGFKCPPHRDEADFLLDLGTKKQIQYEVSSDAPRSISEFAEAFMRSSIFKQTVELQTAPTDPTLIEAKRDFIDSLPEFHQNFWDSTRTVFRRQWKLVMRDKAFLIGRSVMVILMGLLYSTTFYQFNASDAQLVMGIIFYSMMFVSLGQQAQIPTFMAAREVFYKQRGFNFFRTASYVLSNSVSQLPLAVIETIVFGSTIYWMCGYVSSVKAFFIFEVMILLTNLCFGAWFFFLAAVCPNLNVANPVSLVSVLFFLMFGGFVITKDQIPDFLIWIYWINPMAWGVRALAVNEYTDSTFDTCMYDGTDYCTNFGVTMGEYSLQTFELQTDKVWLWYGMIFMAASNFFFMFLTVMALEHFRFESLDNFSLCSDSAQPVGDDYTLMHSPHSDLSVDELAVPVAISDRQSFVPVALAFKNLWYSVPDPANPNENIDLLKGISGYALPGTITALMGSSGAGKTTLMDVIAGRKTGGKITGEVLLNGHPATDLATRRSTGYCEQMDIHSDSSTFREAFTFSAFLRQSAAVPDSHKLDSVNECLELLDLNPIADQIIRGSSVEQMKRLTIGVELAAQPSVLFLDEPTSGLDARSAKLIMDGVRKVADTGRTVVCTIHQPSSEVFQVFDSLLLLKRGGETVYFGELGKNSREMINYFEAIDGVRKLEENYNPATWMMEVIGAGVGNDNGDMTDFVNVFKESRLFESLQAGMTREGVFRPSPSVPALKYDDKRAATELTQAKFLMKRFFLIYWRTASYNLTRFFISIFLGLLFGLTYGSAEYGTYSGINSGMGMMYASTGFFGFVSFSGAVPVASTERLSFYRERAAQTYNAFWYFVASTIVEIPYVFISTLMFVGIFFPMVGFTGFGTFLSYWLYLSLHSLWHAYFGYFMAYVTPTVDVATIFGVLIISIFLLFSGFNPPGDSIPQGYKWIYDIDPMTYSLAILASIVFGDCSNGGSVIGCKTLTDAPPTLPENLTVKLYLESVFSIKHSDLHKNVGFIVGFIVLYRILALLALRFINHMKK